MRVLALGSPCDESVAAIGAMLTAGVTLAGIVAARPPLAAADGGWADVESLARRHGVPFIAVTRRSAELRAALDRFRPEVIVAACYPWRLPAAVLALPPLGCLNIHPSLLPHGQGPDPVFWTYRRGESETGVTVHLMDAGFDTGPILGQRQVAVPVGSRAPELEQSLMALGGELAAHLLPDFAAGTTRPLPQDEALATAAPFPTTDDFVIPTTMPAAAAYAFARGVAPRHGPLTVHIEPAGNRLPVRDAIDFAADDLIDDALRDDGRGIVRVRFGRGWVRFLRADAGRYPLSLSPIKARDIR